MFDLPCRQVLGAALSLATVLATSAGAQQPTEETIQLNVGVRADAPPFSYIESGAVFMNREETVRGPLFDADYRGYAVQVCDAALRATRDRLPNVTFEVLQVTTLTRFDDQRADWHILCDPASLTPLRLSEHEPTLPIYLSGIGFAKRQQLPKGISCQSIAGVAANTTTAHAGILAIADAGAIPRWTDQLRNGAKAGDANTLKCDGAPDTQVVKFKETHTELAQELCSGEILYYIGDLEIVRASLASHGGCEVEFSETTYRDERYTIYTESGNLNEGQIKALNVFREELSRLVLQDGSVLLSAYRAYLSTQQKSRKLSAFYWGVVGAFE